MREWCNCDSRWILEEDVSRSQRATGKGLWCDTCCLFYWYEPHYENMMYDLKEMNQC